MSPDETLPLRPTLERAKSTLKTALGEVCRTDLERADTGELIRIKDVLAIANEAAKEAITVRRRIRVAGGELEEAEDDDPSPVGG